MASSAVVSNGLSADLVTQVPVADVVDHRHEVETWPIGRTSDGEQVLLSECSLCGELFDLTV